MGAKEDFGALINNTDVIRHLIQLIDQEPLRIFTTICKQHQQTGQAVPDHRLHLATYVGDLALKALVTAGLLQQESGGRVSLFKYQPTEQGLTQYKALMAEERPTEQKEM